MLRYWCVLCSDWYRRIKEEEGSLPFFPAHPGREIQGFQSWGAEPFFTMKVFMGQRRTGRRSWLSRTEYQRWWLNRVSPLRTSDGTHVLVISVLDDVVTITRLRSSRNSLSGVINFLLNKNFSELFYYKINWKLRKCKYLHKHVPLCRILRKYRGKWRNEHKKYLQLKDKQ